MIILIYLKKIKMNPKGRPSNEKPTFQHEERSKKAQPIKQFWTEHRLTLIAYQAQYVKAKQPPQQKQQKSQQSQTKKKGSRKKVNLPYQSAFLSISPQQSEQIKVQQLIKPYDSLVWLFFNQHDANFISVKEFIKILLQLKHSDIVKQFCQIYNIVVRELKSLEFEQVQKQDSRFQLLQSIKQKILTYIQSKSQKFSYFTSYLKNDGIQTKKLILVEAYCIIAEKFNFNINQFYSQAFAVDMQSKPSPTKKVKKDKS